MNSRHIQPVAYLLQKNRLPVAARRRRKAIRQSIPADNDNLRVGPASQYVGKRTHEDMVAPERLEIAHDKCYNLIRTTDLSAVRKHEVRLRIGSHARRINSFMNDFDLALIMPWKSRLL